MKNLAMSHLQQFFKYYKKYTEKQSVTIFYFQNEWSYFTRFCIFVFLKPYEIRKI